VYTFKTAEFEHLAVSCNDRVCTTGNRAFENPVIGVVPEDLEPAPWPNRFGKFRQQNGDPRQFLTLSGKFPGENGQDFTHYWPGNEEMISSFNYPKSGGFLRLFSRKNQCENEDVAVEDNPHFLR
jgi:hypothetical protein